MIESDVPEEKVKSNGVTFYKCPADCPVIIGMGASEGMTSTDNDNKGKEWGLIEDEATKLGFKTEKYCSEPEYRPRATKGMCHLKIVNP